MNVCIGDIVTNGKNSIRVYLSYKKCETSQNAQVIHLKVYTLYFNIRLSYTKQSSLVKSVRTCFTKMQLLSVTIKTLHCYCYVSLQGMCQSFLLLQVHLCLYEWIYNNESAEKRADLIFRLKNVFCLLNEDIYMFHIPQELCLFLMLPKLLYGVFL